MDRYSVYVKADGGRIIDLDGGVTPPAILDGWVKIDEGTGEKYALCQNHYLPKPLYDWRGIPRYRLVDGVPIERSVEEMDAEFAPEPSLQEIVEELKTQNEMFLECLLELSEEVYN